MLKFRWLKGNHTTPYVDRFLFKQQQKMERSKVTEAAVADLLEAASNYGKLEEKGYGKYVEKAEDYLHSFNSSAAAEAGGEKKESGSGDYLKMAQGFLKKEDGEKKDSSSGEKKEGGSGGYLKLAQGFF